MLRWIIVTLVFLTTSCGGLKSGYFSMPYTGVKEPTDIVAKTFHQRYELMDVELPGLKVHVDLNNEKQTSDVIWFGVGVPMIPVPVDLQEKNISPTRYTSGYCIMLVLKPLTEGMRINPYLTSISVNSAVHKVAEAKDIQYFKNEKGGTERKETNLEKKEIVMRKDTSRIISFCFIGEQPTTRDAIALDLGKAVTHPEGGIVPIIRFKRVRYRSPYS